MNKSNSLETYDNFVFNQIKIRLDEISKIESYFIEEINQRKSCSKKLSKYAAAFDYINKILIVSYVATGGVSICSFRSIAGAPVEIASASFTLTFFLTTVITKKPLTKTREKKGKS